MIPVTIGIQQFFVMGHRLFYSFRHRRKYKNLVTNSLLLVSVQSTGLASEPEMVT